MILGRILRILGDTIHNSSRPNQYSTLPGLRLLYRLLSQQVDQRIPGSVRLSQGIGRRAFQQLHLV